MPQIASLSINFQKFPGEHAPGPPSFLLHLRFAPTVKIIFLRLWVTWSLNYFLLMGKSTFHDNCSIHHAGVLIFLPPYSHEDIMHMIPFKHNIIILEASLRSVTSSLLITTVVVIQEWRSSTVLVALTVSWLRSNTTNVTAEFYSLSYLCMTIVHFEAKRLFMKNCDCL